MAPIRYTQTPRWKYRTAAEYRVSVGFYETRAERGNDYVWLDHGLLTVAKHYAWDGPSGPTIDTRNWMRPSLVHDALYQLLRERHLPQDMRKTVDALMYRQLRQDGMSYIRAITAYRGVRLFGAKHAAAIATPKILTAP